MLEEEEDKEEEVVGEEDKEEDKVGGEEVGREEVEAQEEEDLKGVSSAGEVVVAAAGDATCAPSPGEPRQTMPDCGGFKRTKPSTLPTGRLETRLWWIVIQ